MLSDPGLFKALSEVDGDAFTILDKAIRGIGVVLGEAVNELVAKASDLPPHQQEPLLTLAARMSMIVKLGEDAINASKESDQ